MQEKWTKYGITIYYLAREELNLLYEPFPMFSTVLAEKLQQKDQSKLPASMSELGRSQIRFHHTMEGANLPDPHGVGYLLTHSGEIHLQHLSYVNVNRSYDTIMYIRHPMKCTTTKIKPINFLRSYQALSVDKQ